MKSSCSSLNSMMLLFVRVSHTCTTQPAA
jgi:hypothetical protein